MQAVIVVNKHCGANFQAIGGRVKLYFRKFFLMQGLISCKYQQCQMHRAMNFKQFINKTDTLFATVVVNKYCRCKLSSQWWEGKYIFIEQIFDAGPHYIHVPTISGAYSRKFLTFLLVKLMLSFHWSDLCSLVQNL